MANRDNNLDLYPVPQKILFRSEKITIPEKIEIHLTVNSDNKDFLKLTELWLSRKNYAKSPYAQIELNIEEVKGEAFSYNDSQGKYSEEIYNLDLSQSGKTITVNISVSKKRGLYNSLATLGQLLSKKTIPSCTINDYPCFGIRAVIEGYYGPPWSSDDRLAMLDLLSDYKFNAYFYSPKDDIYHREKWRDFYPAAILSELEKLVVKTSDSGLEFWYNIGPGLSMQYSSETDFNALIQKYEQLYSIGIRCFGLLFDDISEHLQHIEDQKVFSDISSAHVTVANRVYQALIRKDPNVKFVVCPTQYWGKGTEYYISNMGSMLNPRIELYWTGPEICSRELNLSDASVFARQTNRPVLYWDNYPVNDLEMANEMHIGPYLSRDRHLYRASAGIVANAMEYAECSKIPLITIASYLWNPENYDSESAWRHALLRVAGEKDSEDFYIFADNSRYSCLFPTDSPYLRKILSQFEFDYKYGDKSKAMKDLRAAVDYLSRAVELFNRGMENKKLSVEINRWSRKFINGVELLDDVCKSLEKRDSDEMEKLKIRFDEFQTDSTYIFADILYPFIDAVIKEM